MFQGGDITQKPPTIKLAWPLNHFILCGHVTHSMHHISTCRRPMDTKLNQVLNCHDKVPPLKLHYILKFDRVTIVKSLDKLKKYICILQDLLPLNLVVWWLSWVGSECKSIIYRRSNIAKVFNYFCFKDILKSCNRSSKIPESPFWMRSSKQKKRILYGGNNYPRKERPPPSLSTNGNP